MPTTTYDLIDSRTLSTNAGTIIFDSLPSTYQDLVLVVEGLGSGGEVLADLRFNGDSGSNYSFRRMRGSSTTASSNTGNTKTVIGTELGFANGSERGSQTMYIMDYSASDRQKTVLITENSRGVYGVAVAAARWTGTAAITSITVRSTTNTFAAGTNFYLYGIVS